MTTAYTIPELMTMSLGRRQPLKREFRIGASWTFCQDEIRFRGIVGRIVVNLFFYNFKHEISFG
jgi:hypothetical protein